MKPENPKKVENNIQSGTSEIHQGSRNVTDFLPTIFKTTTNKQFLGTTLENLFSSGTTENFDSYWGKLDGSNFDYKTDSYNKETTPLRQNHQFVNGFKSDGEGFDTITSYINIIKKLTNDGYDTSDMNRLTAEREYILDLPINHDMFVNHLNYHWLIEEIPVCEITATVADPIDIDNIVKLNSYTTPVLENGKTLEFVNGLRIKFVGSNATSSSGDYSVDSIYFVEGIGTGQLKLIEQYNSSGKDVFPRMVPYTPMSYVDGWDSVAFGSVDYDDSNYVNILKEYVVVDRSSKDKNAWARVNKWYSIYSIRTTSEYNDLTIGSITNEKTSARRPIIQFDPNIELYNNGKELNLIVDHHVDSISVDDIIGSDMYYNNGYYLEDDDYVLVTDFNNSNNFEIYLVSNVGTAISLTAVTSQINLQEFDKLLLIHSNVPDYIGNEYYYSNGTLVRSYQKKHRSDSPMFNLYSSDLNMLADYQDSSFKGNSVFSYKTSDTSVTDQESGLSLVVNSSGPDQYKFDISVETEYTYSDISGIMIPIKGDYFYKVIDNYRSVWSPTKDIQRSKVTEVIVVEEDNQTVSRTISTTLDTDEFIVQTGSKIRWFEKKNGYVYGDGEINPKIHLLKEKIYTINVVAPNSLNSINENTFAITDPYGNISSDVTLSVITPNRFDVSISYKYPYDTLLYVDDISGETGYIFVENDYNYCNVLKNGDKLQESVDFAIDVTGVVTITTDLSVGDVIEFNYYSDDNTLPHDFPSNFKYNPLNEKITEIGVTEITDHFVNQNVSNPYLVDSLFVGDNNYHKLPKESTYGGNIRQQLYSPAPHSILHSFGNFDLLLSLDIVKDDYESFKNIFKTKIRQLWRDNSYYTIRDLVDLALGQINIGKDETFRYAYSNMAFYDLFETYNFTATDINLSFTIPFVENAYGTVGTSYQLWANSEETGKWVPLRKDIDFTISFDVITVNASVLGSSSSANIEVRKYDNSSKSYIPYSPSKLGFTKKHTVDVINDYVVCHDGSYHKLTSSEIFDIESETFDVVSAAIYDLETRIYNNLDESNDDITDFLPSFNTNEFMNYGNFNAFMKDECNNWASKFSDGYKEVRINEFDSADNFTFNYSDSTGNFQSYKSLYMFMFNTYRPHTHPWEMFGYKNEPEWWMDLYDWTDPVKRENLIFSLKNGIFDSARSSSDIRYAYYYYDWDNSTLVTETGELNDPISAGIVKLSDLSTKSVYQDFEFGNYMYQVEENWTQTSNYLFSLAKVFFKLKPYKMWNLFWIKNDIITIDGGYKEYNIYERNSTRLGLRNDNLHLTQNNLKHVYDIIIPDNQQDHGTILSVNAPVNETYGKAVIDCLFDSNNAKIENAKIVNSGYGYRTDFNLLIETETGIYSSEVLAKVEKSPINPLFGVNSIIVEQYSSIVDISKMIENTITLPVVHIGGFTKSDLIKITLDGSYNKGSVAIPSEDYGIRIVKSPPSRKVPYSGLMITQTDDGYYQLDGYNSTERYFNIIPVNVSGSQSDVEISSSVSIKRYNKFHNKIDRIPYGTKIKKRQDLYSFIQGLEQYYKAVGFHNLRWSADAISVMQWAIENSSIAEVSKTMVNGLINNKIIIQHGSHGFVNEFSKYNSYKTPINDVFYDSIDPSEFIIIRNENFTEVSPKTDNPLLVKKLYGITFEIVDYEHLLYINPITKFNDIVQDATTGIFNSRIKIKGERTKNWNGRTETPGFLISSDGITNNFDSNVREIEQDIMNSYSKMLNPLTRKTDKSTVGYQEKSYFIDMGGDEDSAYEFYKGVRKYKGTKLSIDAVLRNKNVFAKNADSISEEWMIYSKDYGDKSISDNISVEIPRSLVKTDPQVIRFTENSVKDSPYDGIIDISEGSSHYISGNFDRPIPTIPEKPFSIRNIEDIKYFEKFAKTSGIPFENEVDYVVGGIRDMLDVYEYTSSYATVPLWSSKVSYQKGDIVRKGPSVYKYLLESTGLGELTTQSYIRGNVTFPSVPSGSTFIIGARQEGETELTYYTIVFNKSQGSATYIPYELLGLQTNPTTDIEKFITINGTEVVFSSSTATPVNPEFQTITAIGTLSNFGVNGEFLDQIIIDDHRIRLNNYNVVGVNPAIPLTTALSLMGTTLINSGLNNVSSYLSSLPDIMSSLRTSYISELSLQEWYNFLSNYYGGIHSGYGFNINYLTTFYDTLTGFETYFDDFTNFYENEIEIYNTLFGTTIIKGETQVPQNIITNMIVFLQESRYSTLVSRYISSGGPINKSDYVDVLGAVEQEPLNSDDIVQKINDYFSSNGLSAVYTVSIVDGTLSIIKNIDIDSTTGLLEIIDASGTDLGFASSVNSYSTIDEIQNIQYIVTLQNMVNTINSYGISGITASTVSVGQDEILKITSTNPTLTIGQGSANDDIGLVEAVYNANFVEGTNLIDLDADDVVEQINDTSIQNVVASNVNNSVVLTATVAEFDIGAGTANSALGFTDINPITSMVGDESAGTAFNLFNSPEWAEIPDPIDFSVWVNNNLDPIITNTNRNSGYNVYQSMDFDLEIREICPGTFSNDDAMVKFYKPHNLRVNDYVVLTATNSRPNLDGMHRVTAIYSDTIIFIESYIKSNGSYGKCIPLRPVRFANTQQMLDSGFDPRYHTGSYGWKLGMYAYVDSYEGTGIPAAYRCIDVDLYGGVYFELVRKFERLADNSKLKSAYVYDYKTHEIKSELEVYDPVKGIIPGIAELEIDIKSIYDNARYTESSDSDEKIDTANYWSDDHINEVWWDMSTAIYLEYEQGNLEYRQQNWGKLFETSSIDIYEWTKSPVPPDEYQDAVNANAVIDGVQLTGTPYYRVGQYGDNEYYWTEKTYFERSRGITETYYYFWVKDKTTVPSKKRKYTTTDLENIIENPSSYGINWIAAISDTSVMVSNLGNCLACNNAVLNIWFKESDDSYHKEYMLLSEDEKDRKIPKVLHDTLRDSLAGYTDSLIKLDYSLWLSFKPYKKDDVVKYENRYYIATRNNLNAVPSPQDQTSPVIFENDWYELQFIDSIKNEDVWDIKKYGYVWDENVWDTYDWDKPFPENINDVDGELYIKSLSSIPDYEKHYLKRYGISEKKQSWFKNITNARKEFIYKINYIIKNMNMIEMQSLWYSEFNKLFHASGKVFETNYVQYKLSDMYSYIDWFVSERYKNITSVDHTVNTSLDIPSISPIQGDIMCVLNDITFDGVKRKKFYEYDGAGWNLVYHEKATIEFSDELWNPAISPRNWSDDLWDIDGWDRDTGPYFHRLIDILYNSLFANTLKGMYNNLWFTMLRYVHTEQDFVKWAIKSSYFKTIIENDLQVLKKYKKDNLQSVLDYINDVKPFTSKLRDFQNIKDGLDKFSVTIEEIDNYKTIGIKYEDVSTETAYDGDVILTDTFTNVSDKDTITSSMETEVFDYIYDGNVMDYSNEKFSDELIPARIHDSVGIFITRNEDGSTEASSSKRYVMHVNNHSKIKYSISTNDDISAITNDISKTDTTIEVDDGSIFLFNSGTTISKNKGVAWINGERIEYKNVIGNLLLNCVRGTGGTAPREHLSGENIVYAKSEYNDYPPMELSTIMYNAINYN